MNVQAPSNSDGRLDVVLLDELWDFADPAASEERFRRAVVAAPIGGTARAELTTQLARSMALQGRFDEAAALLDGVDQLDLPAVVVTVRSRLERGRVLNSGGDPAAARPLFHEALTLARSVGEEFLAIDAAHMLAIADQDHADEWTALGLGLVASAEDPRSRRWAGSLHNNAGWSRHDAGDFAGALSEFEAALNAYSADGTAEQVRVARWAVARALRSLGRFDEALDIQLGLAELGPSDGYVEEELAELLLATGDRTAAAEHAAAAAGLLGADNWFAEFESGRLARLRQLAQDGTPAGRPTPTIPCVWPR